MTPRIAQYAREAGSTPEAVCARIPLGWRLKGHPAADARRAVIRRLRADGFSITQIGRWMGIHHTTVSYWSADR